MYKLDGPNRLKYNRELLTAEQRLSAVSELLVILSQG
jgi:hypothetical protein